jgi:hypothetical protein
VTRFSELLRVLAGAGVEYILVGGVAAAAHGSARGTQDLDLVYRRTPENLSRLARALAPLKPYLRGAPPGLPFRLDEPTLAAGLNFTLTTSLGWLNLLGEIAGGGRYEDLFARTVTLHLSGVSCPVLDLPALIEAKTAAGRPKDLESIAELRQLLQRRAP